MAIEPLRFGQYYHIFNRGNNRENLFLRQHNYPYFMKLYAKHILPVAQTFAYSLLPNHFHFAIRTRTQDEQALYWEEEILPSLETPKLFKLREPSQAFKNMFIAYTKALNKENGRTGALFERPFGRKLVTSDAYLQTLIVYIHQNPQNHGLIDDFRDWKWSSFEACQSDRPTKIEKETVLEWFGDRNAFARGHADEADTKLIELLLFD